MSTQLDPFAAALIPLRHSIYISTSPAFTIQLNILSGVLGFVLLLQLGTLLVRWRKGDFWLFRRKKTVHGTFIVPHGVLGYTLIGAIFCCVIQGDLWAMRAYATPSSNLHNNELWQILTWIPLNWGIWILTWATLVSPLISRPADQNTGFSLSHHPRAINIFFLIHPFVFCGALIPFAIIANNSWNHFIGDVGTLCSLLEQASTAVQQGLPPPNLELMQSLKDSLALQKLVALANFRHCYISWLPFLGFQLVVFGFAAIVHFRSLSGAMRHLRAKRNKGNIYDQDFEAISVAYRTLLATTVLVGFVDLVFFSLDALIVVSSAKPGRGWLTEGVVLVYTYTYAVCGGATAVVIFVRSFSATTSTHRSTIITSGSLSTSRTTHHHYRPDGSNSANISVLRTIDIRTDAEGRSAYELDFTGASRSIRSMDEKGDFEIDSSRSDYGGRGNAV